MSFDGSTFRSVLGRLPTGVTVITCDPPGGPPQGLTIGSFTSVSLDPPLVAFMPARTAESWPAIEAAGAFCVNVLCTGQVELSNRFASKDPQKFAGVDWSPAPGTGAPVLSGVAAWVDCRIEAIHEGGDHWIVVGRVDDLGTNDAALEPLVFLGGGYGRFQGLS